MAMRTKVRVTVACWLRQSFWLLPVLAILTLTACGGDPVDPADPETPEELVAVADEQTVSDEPAAAPTPVPRVEFMGVSLAHEEALFGPLQQAGRRPPVPPGGSPGYPESIYFAFGPRADLAEMPPRGPLVAVFPVAHYRSMSQKAARHLDTLRVLLTEKPAYVEDPLPMLPLLEMPIAEHTAPSYSEFANGTGLSFVTPSPERGSTGSGWYVFQGLTNDDRFFVTAFVPVQAEQATGTQPVTVVDSSQVPAAHEMARTPANLLDADRVVPEPPALDATLETLNVEPEAEFMVPMLSRVKVSDGVMISYGADIVSRVDVHRIPAVVEDPDGDLLFLEGVPDLIELTFDAGRVGTTGKMRIQALRDEEGEYYAGVPAWQRHAVTELGDHLLDLPVGTGGATGVVSFQSGEGTRTIVADGASGEIYRFTGLTGDGRYWIAFEFPLANESVLPEKLDQMLMTLAVAPDATTVSSVPANDADCTNEAEFIRDVSYPDNSVVERGQTFQKLWRVRNVGTCTWTPAYGLVYAEGNPLEWHDKRAVGVVPPNAEADVRVTIVSPDAPAFYRASWRLQNADGDTFGPPLSILFEAPRAATDIPDHGVVEGTITYPAGGMPSMTIYFLRTDGSERYALKTEEGWNRYVNAVPVGEYYVFARVTGDESNTGGGYTAAAVCGLQAACEDHTLMPVVVEEGKATRDVDISDWYAPAGTFPLP